MKNYNSIRPIPLSALQHYVFCPRQCALIHNERIWSENHLTVIGNQLHERVDSGVSENRKGLRYERGVSVNSEKYNLIGRLDLLEIDTVNSTLTPIEYKKGSPKKDLSDKVQLCAQALCLEEMRGVIIKSAAFWYWKTRKRYSVDIDDKLREATFAAIQGVKALFNSLQLPVVSYRSQCKLCSLISDCAPLLFRKDKSKEYLEKIYNE